MLRVIVDVNGYEVSRLYVHNNNGTYDAGIWNHDQKTGIIGIEGVKHHRADPWWMLVQRISERISGK